MISSLKTKILILVASMALLLGGFAILNHHPMPMASGDNSECNTTCKIACFSQSIVNGITTPAQLDTFLFILPFTGLALILFIAIEANANNQTKFRYNHGPPLYIQFESYRY